jgi:hypothetical protein
MRWKVTVTFRAAPEKKSKDEVHDIADLAEIGSILANGSEFDVAYLVIEARQAAKEKAA